MSRVLAIGDVHAPCELEGYRDFCKDVYDAWDCDKVVFLGDLVDMHNESVHDPEPEAPGPKDEADLAHEAVQKWREAFPIATVTVGNHDDRVVKAAKRNRIPKQRFIRTYQEAWETSKWEWVYEKDIDGTFYFHGDGFSGLHPAYNASRQMAMSVVMGHIHTAGGVQWHNNPRKSWFGMDVGCGIDDKQWAFYYAKTMKRRPCIGCGVVIDGKPYHEKM